jgi:ABC-2 type transport system permease protein
MILLTFFSILVFSNIVSSLTTFFVADDLILLNYLPFDLLQLYLARLFETFVTASWMLLVFGLPVFLAYGQVYQASWFYYLVLTIALLSFAVICSVLGTAITMVLVNLFPVRQIKDIFFLLSILLLASLYIVFRILQPEKLVNPEAFASVALYIDQIKAPASPLLPSFWVKEALFPILMKESSGSSFFLLLLLSTALAFIILGHRLATWLYPEGFSKAQEARDIRLTKTSLSSRFFHLLTFCFPQPLRGIILKDLKTFFRDTSQWSQILLLLALIIVYLYNIWALPLDKVKFPSFYLENLIAFLNLGLAGFVTAAVAARFVFPAISLEKEGFWLIQTAPISTIQFVASKYLTSLFPLLLLAEILVIVSNYLLHATAFLMILSSITIFLMTLGITSLGIGMGAKYPNFKAENPAQIATSYGGVLYMVTSLLYITIIVALEARPVYNIFYTKFYHISLSLLDWMEIGVLLTLALVIHLITIYIPLKIGLRQLEQIEC